VGGHGAVRPQRDLLAAVALVPQLFATQDIEKPMLYDPRWQQDRDKLFSFPTFKVWLERQCLRDPTGTGKLRAAIGRRRSAGCRCCCG
jgi:hypothetical protein